MSFPEKQLEGSTETTWEEEKTFKGSLKKNLLKDQPGGASKAAHGEERVEKASLKMNFPKEPPGGTAEQTWSKIAADSEDFTYPVEKPLSTSSYHRMEEQTGGQQETDRVGRGRPPSPVSSVLSMKTDMSMSIPMNFKGQAKGTKVSAGQVLCDVSVCHNPAVKACLTCGDSYCMICIRPHYSDPDLDRHQLQDLQYQSLCEQHNRELEFYCRTDQSAICSRCALHKHRGHDVIDLEETDTDQDPQETHSKTFINKECVPPTGQTQIPSEQLDLVGLHPGESYCSDDGSQSSSEEGSTHTAEQLRQEKAEQQQKPLEEYNCIQMAVSMESPVCLINDGPDGRMRIQQEALQILEQIQQPVVVVAVVGLYRTGKSYLMNRMAGKHTGFALGSTIESKTKGIWMWCVPHPSKQGHTLVLLDTEGLGDVEKGGDKYDAWIFCLAVLLSSTLVYNSMGIIDDNALEKLQYVTELTEHIKMNSSEYEQSTELMCFPSFVWTVRDFTLELILNGKPVTADQYLENALKLKSGDSVEVQRHNQVRQGLRDFFAERRCFVFERPASVRKMRQMEELTDADLDPDFVETAQEFCSYIFSSSKPKTMRGGLGVTGRMLASLAETYVQAIRSGQVPCLESAVESLALIQNSRAVEEALEFYRIKMEQQVQLPTETEEALSDLHAAVEEQAISIFIKGSFNDHEHKYQLELMTRMKERFEDWCRRNVQESQRVAQAILSRVFAALEEGVEEGSYMREGGYEAFRSDLENGTQRYRAESAGGLLKEEVLTNYLKEKDAVGKNIQAADHSLTEARQRMEAEQQQRKQAEQKQKQAEQQRMQAEQQQMQAEQQRIQAEQRQKQAEQRQKQLEQELKDNEPWYQKAERRVRHWVRDTF